VSVGVDWRRLLWSQRREEGHYERPRQRQQATVSGGSGSGSGGIYHSIIHITNVCTLFLHYHHQQPSLNNSH